MDSILKLLYIYKYNYIYIARFRNERARTSCEIGTGVSDRDRVRVSETSAAPKCKTPTDRKPGQEIARSRDESWLSGQWANEPLSQLSASRLRAGSKAECLAQKVPEHRAQSCKIIIAKVGLKGFQIITKIST